MKRFIIENSKRSKLFRDVFFEDGTKFKFQLSEESLQKAISDIKKNCEETRSSVVIQFRNERKRHQEKAME